MSKKKIIISVIVVIVIAIVGLSFFFTGQKYNSPSPEGRAARIEALKAKVAASGETKRAENTTSGISLSYPGYWEEEHLDNDRPQDIWLGLAVKYSDKGKERDERAGEIFASRDQLPDGWTLKQYTDSWIAEKEFTANLNKVPIEVTKNGKFQTAAEEGIEIVYTEGLPKGVLSRGGIFVVRGQYVYTVMFAAEKELLDVMLPSMESIARSLMIK